MSRSAFACVALLLLTACSGGRQAATADDVIAQVGRLPSVEKTVRITGSNDPGDSLGRPDGYDAGAVFYDSRLQCPQPGIDCGAVLEVWPDADDARTRSEYLSSLQSGMQMLGSEHHFRAGELLLRVSGDLKPQAAASYRAALTGR